MPIPMKGMTRQSGSSRELQNEELMEICETSKDFFEFLEDWVSCLKYIPLVEAAVDPKKTAILSQDMIKGFCTIGPLASPRVNGIAGRISVFFQKTYDYGIRDIILFQDSHEPEAIEFDAYPPHCIRGTEEAEPVDQIRALPFFDKLEIIEKNSISSGVETGFDGWLAARPHLDTFIIVGDCTDICVYQLALHLRVSANARQIFRRIIIPASMVQTYDQTVPTTREQGGFPHPGDLMHQIFLYHMALNAIEVVQDII
jgi:nicotinamidase-related amidase